MRGIIQIGIGRRMNMKKFTKRFLTVSAIVTSLAGALFGGTFGLDAMVENSNKNKISEIRSNQERYEKENIEKIENNAYPQYTYERKKMTNNKSVDFSQFTIPTELFTKEQGYLVPIKSSGSSGYKNFQRNKHLYVYMDNNLTASEKQLIGDAVSYIDAVVSYINNDYSLKITDKLEDSHAYIHVLNNSNINAGSNSSNVLGVTEIADLPSPLYFKPIKIHMNNENINKFSFGNYNLLYKGTFIHEFLHAAGLEHSKYFYDNEDKLIRPIMSAAYGNTDYLSIPELAELFGWLNKDKYSQAKQNGSLQEECNKDFMNYLFLIKYGLNQSLTYNQITSSSLKDIEDNQVFQIQYDETPDDGIDNKTTLTFNYPYRSFCEKITPKEDGSVEKVIRPFVLSHNSEGKGNIVILNQDCRHHDEMSIRHSEDMGNYLYKNGLTFNEVMNELRTMDPRNGYIVCTDSATKQKHIEYETQNLWEYLTHTSTTNDIVIEEQLYKILYKYTWSIEGNKAEETTNNFDKNLLKNYNVSYVGNDYAKN